MSKTICFKNGRILRNHTLQIGNLFIANGKIVSDLAQPDETIDLNGKILAPGYVDLQINGGFGIDLNAHPEQIDAFCQQLPACGVTAFLPTIISSPPEFYRRAIPLLQPRKTKGAEILGIHLEGPYLSTKRPGAHPLHCFKDFTNSPSETYGSLEGVKMITLAPELHEAFEAFQDLGIILSAGHTDASYEETTAHCQVATHLFNAMSPFHHRAPGAAGAVLTKKCSYSLIADLKHVHPGALLLAYLSNPEGLFLISDMIAHTTLGENQLFDYKLSDGTLAGSKVGLDQCVRNFHAATGCSIPFALEAASWKPACLLGISNRKGSLQIGCDADLLILNDALFVETCYIGGESFANKS